MFPVKVRLAVCICLVFSVTVMSEEGRPMTFNPSAATMLLWQGGPTGRDKVSG